MFPIQLFKDDESFWFTIWSMAGLVLLAIVSIVNYNIHKEDEIVAQLIREGHDPLKLECVYGNSDAKHCSIYAIQEVNKRVKELHNEVNKPVLPEAAK